MKLNQLKKSTTRSKKRVGRGYGSGKGGHTSGRGAKGQKARGKDPLYFEGTAMRKSLIRRMPMIRGKLKFKSFRDKPIILNLKHLNLLPKNSIVDNKNLIKHGLLPKEAQNHPVKILGDGELKHALKVTLSASKSAVKKIEKAGGKMISVADKVLKKSPKKTVKAKPSQKKSDKEKKVSKTKKKITKKITKKTTKKTTKKK